MVIYEGIMNKYQKLLTIISYAKPGKRLLLIIGCLSMTGAASTLLFPLLTQNLIDSFSSSSSLPSEWIVFLVGALAIGSIASGVSYFLIGKVANRMLVNLRTKVLSKSFRLPVKYYDNNQSSEPASRIVNDTEVVNTVVSQHFEPFMSGVLTLVSSLIILWVLDWQLTAVLFATLLIAFLITIPIASKLSQLSKSIQKEEANFLSYITERLSQIRLIKACTAEQDSIQSSRNTLDSLYQLGLKEVKIGAVMAPIAGITIITTLIVILAFGAARVSEGVITMGTLIAFILYLFNIVFPLIQFTYFVAALNKAAGAAERITELLDETEEQTNGDSNATTKGSQIETANSKEKSISIRQLSFSYTQDKSIFKQLNLRLPINQTIALVGESGSGKSTLFSLLLRYYAPTAGKIEYKNQVINELPLNEWRKQIAYIAQDAPLLSGTLLENLTLGLKQIPDEKTLHHKLQLAQLSDFVSGLSSGLNTQIGERGIRLSGGQKQRLAIARAMLQDAPILLCDEATSNLDSVTEHKIQQAMKLVAKNRTTLIAAHRLSTVIDADLIVVLKNGEVIGQGTHTELIQSTPYYKELVEFQLAASDWRSETSMSGDPQQVQA